MSHLAAPTSFCPKSSYTHIMPHVPTPAMQCIKSVHKQASAVSASYLCQTCCYFGWVWQAMACQQPDLTRLPHDNTSKCAHMCRPTALRRKKAPVGRSSTCRPVFHNTRIVVKPQS